MKKAKQIFIGISLVILGIISVILTYDITVALWFVPLGLYVAITKKDVIND